MSNSLQPHGLYSPWNSPGQNTGVGSLSLLQGILPIQGRNSGLPHCRQILYQLSHKGSPRIQGWVALPFSRGSSQPRDQTPVFHNAGGFFTNWVTLEAKCTINVMHLNHPETVSPLPSPMFLETLSSTKLVPGAKNIGNPWRSSLTHHLQESTCSRGSTHLPILCAENACPCFWTQIDLFLLAPKNLSRRTFMEVWLERVLVVIFTLESQRQIKILFNFLKTFTKLAYT